jgi:copper chaperone
MRYHVPDMTCDHCRATVERAVTAADSMATLRIDADARIVEIDTHRNADEMRAALRDAGYETVPA